jgi:pantetheine-phosphate adenylyltransferase
MKIDITKSDLWDYYSECFPEEEDRIKRFEICKKFFKNNPFPEIRKKYLEPQRFYHNEKHLNELNYLINYLSIKSLIKNEIKDKLYLLAFFHDAVYDPRKDNNENESAELFLKYILNDLGIKVPKHNFSLLEAMSTIKNRHEHYEEILEIFESILDTKTHKPRNEISEIFCSLDLFCLTNYNFKELIEYEHGIFKEYQYVDYLTYHSKRLDFLFDIKNDLKTNNYNLDLLIQYIKNRKIKVGLYPGSFRPFHIGHLDILKKAESIFDKIIICRGINPSKKITEESFVSNFDFPPYREVKIFSGYQIDFLKSLNESARDYERKKYLNPIIEYVFVRGLRNHTDFDFEFNQLQYNKMLAKEKGIQFNTLFLFSEPEYQHISSSDIRAMENFRSESAKKLIV